jgi:uncharacterized membrane protein
MYLWFFNLRKSILMKKAYAILFFLGCNLLTFAQNIEILNPTTISEYSDLQIINISKNENTELEKNKSYLIDFSLRDLASLSYDSVKIKAGEKEVVTDKIAPFVFKTDKFPVKIEIFTFTNGNITNGKSIFSIEASELKVEVKNEPYLGKDTYVFGLLAIVLALIFYTSSLKGKFWKRLYTFLPALLLCYLIPALFNSFGIISEDHSGLYNMAKDYLLPAALVLMTLGIDFKALINLGPKALIMFLTATVGIIIGGPIAILIFTYIDPSIVGGEGYDATWRGFATLAGSWIGGGANQAAMLETYKYTQALYGKMVTIDIVVANIWMAFLLWAAARTEKFDRWLKADTSSIEELKKKTADFQLSNSRVASLTDYMVILGIAFGIVSISHFFGKDLSNMFENWLGNESPFASGFFWLVVLATTGGLLLSFTKLRSYEGAGASKIGSVFIYILVVTIGMKMGLEQALEEPMLILVGITWMLIHAGLLFLVAKIIKAPFFFIAVGSKANVGGAASAPVVASAFHPSLASVGAILAVLGYALGTYGAILSAELMRYVAP